MQSNSILSDKSWTQLRMVTTWLDDECSHQIAGWLMWLLIPHGWVINLITPWLGDECGDHMAGWSMWSPHAWVAVLHAQGFAPAWRFLWSQIMHRSLYKSPLDETIYLSCVYPCKTITHTHTHTYIYADVKNPPVQWITETQKITQHALNIDVSKVSKLDT